MAAKKTATNKGGSKKKTTKGKTKSTKGSKRS